MQKTLPAFIAFIFSACLSAQTFTGTGGAIDDNLDTTYFLINVSGLSPAAINSVYGLEEVCINITHPKDRDLDIYLESPNGTIIALTTDNGDVGDNYSTTCFRQDVSNSVVSGTAPFNGDYRPEQQLSTFNNGQIGNGRWRLRVYDDNNTGGNAGTLVNWRLTFSNTPATTFQLTSSNLPIIIINTNSQTIADDPKIACDMGIIYNGAGIRNYVTDSFNNYNGKIAIEIRGSTSQQYPKKSYGVETWDAAGIKLNVSLLGMPSEHDWILYGAYPDKSLMRNEITYSLFSRMQPYSPRYVYCELIINGQYIGVYALIEKIKRDKDRVDIARLDSNDLAGDSLTGGYIIKVDKPTGSASTGWTSSYQPKVDILYHDPEDVELLPQQSNYIRTYVTNFENAVYGANFKNPTTGFRAYVNLPSFVDFFIMQELGRTVDGYRSSSFMYKDKDSKGGKLSCGPMWDFNLSYGNCDYCSSYDTTGWQYDFAVVCPTYTTEPPNWWARMLQDTSYTHDVKCRWKQLRTTIFHTDSINAWIDSVALYLNESQQRNFQQWPILGVYVNWNYFIGSTYQQEVNYLKQWFATRSKWMDTHLPGNCWNTGLAENSYDEKDISVFPNPSSGKFTIQSTLYKIEKAEVFDLFGRKIVSVAGHLPVMSLHLTDQPDGIYILKIYSGESFALRKIIKASR